MTEHLTSTMSSATKAISLRFIDELRVTLNPPTKQNSEAVLAAIVKYQKLSHNFKTLENVKVYTPPDPEAEILEEFLEGMSEL
jgi:hypothetical protein